MRRSGEPQSSALSRTLAGRALAQADQNDGPWRSFSAQQQHSTRAARCATAKARSELGHRPHRRTRAGKPDGTSIDSLTERELQVARLVVDRKTNPEIAAELFLSQKTVEHHLRHIFRKIDVSSRVELARAVERADHGARNFALVARGRRHVDQGRCPEKSGCGSG